jgi:methyl-accepting chemotaxis protein
MPTRFFCHLSCVASLPCGVYMSRQNDTGINYSYFSYPAGLGLAGSLLLLIFAGITAWSLTCALLLSTVGLASGWHLSRLAHSREDAPEISRRSYGLRDLCLHMFPIWTRQIDTSRRAGNAATLNLTKIFAMAVDDIQSALSASRSAVAEISDKDGGVLAAINSSEAALFGVVEILKTVQLGKKELHSDVKKFASDLREMVGDVQHIALQVRILSFNAAIEAAHAGKSGAGFAVVAREMRQLSDSSAETSAGMSKRIEKIEAIDATLTDIFQEEQKSTDTDALAIARADTTVREVIEHFKRLTVNLSHSVQIMEKESDEIHGKISSAMVELQFQDRVNQILMHVIDNMNSLLGDVEAKADGDFDIDALLKDMAKDFTTQEEFDNLHGAEASNQKIHDTTFF